MYYVYTFCDIIPPCAYNTLLTRGVQTNYAQSAY